MSHKVWLIGLILSWMRHLGEWEGVLEGSLCTFYQLLLGLLRGIFQTYLSRPSSDTGCNYLLNKLFKKFVFLSKNVPDVRLLISASSRMGIESRMHWLNFVSDCSSSQNISDAFVSAFIRHNFRFESLLVPKITFHFDVENYRMFSKYFWLWEVAILTEPITAAFSG